jgi:putative transposase
MARLPRLYIPGQAQYVILQTIDERPAFVNDSDYEFFLECVRDAVPVADIAIHAYALLPNAVHMMVTPSTETCLPLFMQTVGRRYVARFNREHGRRGTIWAGRYRATAIEGSSWGIFAYQYIDKLVPRSEATALKSTLGLHIGIEGSTFVVHRPEYWALGNTPFDRQHVYRLMCDQELDPTRIELLIDAATRGWALGSPEYLAWAATVANRRIGKMKRGRPRKDGTPRQVDVRTVAKSNAPAVSTVNPSTTEQAPRVLSVPTVWPTFPSLHGQSNDDQ